MAISLNLPLPGSPLLNLIPTNNCSETCGKTNLLSITAYFHGTCRHRFHNIRRWTATFLTCVFFFLIKWYFEWVDAILRKGGCHTTTKKMGKNWYLYWMEPKLHVIARKVWRYQKGIIRICKDDTMLGLLF